MVFGCEISSLALRQERRLRGVWVEKGKKCGVEKASPNIDRVIKSIRLRWAEHEARMIEGKSAFNI